jgi:ABC-2 type transport system permease protein
MVFGRWQFERSLHFDTEGVRAKQAESTASSTWLDWIFRFPSLFFRDPLAALLEKDLRQLARAPRFRLVFFMGFTFGLVVWLPLAFGKGLMTGTATATGAFSANYLTWISVYSVMMLGEVALFNNLGFDRSAAQFYWAAPVEFRTAFLSKNLAASFFIFLELIVITVVCLVLRLPVTPMKIAEAFAVTIVMALFFTGIGNLGSVYSPRSANPQNAWRQSSGGKIQLWLLVVYPCLAVPVSLAYLARYAFESNIAFFVVIGLTAITGWIFRSVATDTAVGLAHERREKILTALSEGDGPIR